jgi:hypothetical protein
MDVSTAQEQIQQAPQKLFASVGSFKLPGGLVFEPNLLQAGAIVLCIFLLILTFGMLQHRYNHWTVKGVMPGVAFGFTIALLLEAILLVGGRTLFTEILGWEDAPKPISNVLTVSRNQLVDVLGVTSEVPEGKASEKPTIGGIMSEYQSLDDGNKESLQSLICPAQ